MEQNSNNEQSHEEKHESNQQDSPQKIYIKPIKNPTRPSIVIVSVICGCIMFLGFWFIFFGQLFGNLFESMGTQNTVATYIPGDRIDVIKVQGTIAEGSTTYNHRWTITEINRLMSDPDNKAIMLYINSPGGGVYESDELYLKLKEYKEKTGKPVYAYMASTAASGGLYTAMAGDKIFANRMTMTGSIGVIMSLTDTTGLQELIGVKEENITSGVNKKIGNPLTEDQRKILQSLIDESYDIFIEVIAESRKLDKEAVRKMADGRVYSPKQAEKLGLIDGIMTYEAAVNQLMQDEKLQKCSVNELQPPATILEELLASASSTLDHQKALSQFGVIQNYIEENSEPKLMYYMQ